MTAAWRPLATRGALLLMETLWVYALVAFLVAAIAPGGRPTIFGVGAIVFASYLISRLLQQNDLSLGVLRTWGVILSLLAFYVIVRIDFFGDLRLWDFRWADELFNDTTAAARANLAAAFGVPILWAFWLRGVLRGQERTGFEEVLGSFAVGILVIALVTLFSPSTDASGLVSVVAVPYVAVGLLAIALSHAARADDEFTRSFGPTWLLAVGGAVLALGIVALAVILIDYGALASLLVDVLSALAYVLSRLIYYVTYPFVWALTQIFDLIGPTLRHLFGGQRQPQPADQPDATPTPAPTSGKALPAGAQLAIRTVTAILIFGGVIIGLATLFITKRVRPDGDAVKESTYQEGRLGSDLGALIGSFFGRLRPNLHFGREQMDPARRLYFDMLDTAAERGVERRPPETPLELSPRIEAALTPDLPAQITQRFNEKHFGSLEPSRAELDRLRAELEATKAAKRAEAP